MLFCFLGLSPTKPAAKHLIEIKNDIERRKQNIDLDNGCVYRKIDLMGNLLCLDLDSFELYVQMNIDF